MVAMREESVQKKCRFFHGWSKITDFDDPMYFIEQCRKCNLVIVYDIENKVSLTGEYSLPDELLEEKREARKQRVDSSD